jgi:hypothetical protein
MCLLLFLDYANDTICLELTDDALSCYAYELHFRRSF